MSSVELLSLLSFCPPPNSTAFSLSSSTVPFHFSTNPPHSALTLPYSSTLHRSSCSFPQHHHVFIITFQLSVGSFYSPLTLPDFSASSTSVYSISTHLFRLVLPTYCDHFCFIHFNVFFGSLILSPNQTFLLLFPSCQFFFLHPLHPPLSSSLCLSFFLSFLLLTVSRAPVLNSLSNPLTSGSIVCPLIITYHLHIPVPTLSAQHLYFLVPLVVGLIVWNNPAPI